MLEFTSNATHMQQVCNEDIDMYRTFFSRDTGECPFLRVSTSGAFAGEYWMGVLALTDIYSTANIARQRDMSKIALQSANDRLKLNFINRIYKLLYIKVGIYLFLSYLLGLRSLYMTIVEMSKAYELNLYEYLKYLFEHRPNRDNGYGR